jgi:hypothetical protein
VPSLPRVPVAPSPVSRPSAPAAPGEAPSAVTGGGPSISSTGGSSSAFAPSGAGSAAGSPARGPRVVRLVSAREWIARSGPKRRRQTTLVFSLTKPGVVEFVLFRVSPDCTVAGRFQVRGKAGTNRLRFRGRIGRVVLRPGTYRIRARGRAVLETTLVILGPRTPSHAQVDEARASNVCVPPPTDPSGQGLFGSRFVSAAPGRREANDKISATPREPGADDRRRGEVDSGVLGTRFRSAGDAVKSLHPLLYILLGMAIALLGIAALPVRVAPNERVATLLEYRRGHIAIAGTMALLAVTVFYVLS